MAYATVAELETFLGAAAPGDAARLLERASALLDRKILVPYAVDADGLPKETADIEVLRDACCAQVEYWIETGDEIGITEGGSFQVGSVQAPRMDRLAPRAGDYLARVGLLNRGVNSR